MFKLPTWLVLLLIPVVFFGSCTLSIVPIWSWHEYRSVRDVEADYTGGFPVLCQTEDGQYVVTRLGYVPADAAIVVAVNQDIEDDANRDLRASVGSPGEYRFFRILENQNGVVRVSLELPTNQDVRVKGWYSLENGQVVPERLLSYGPGMAFVVMPWTLLAGLVGVGLFVLLMKRKKAAKPGDTDNPDGAERDTSTSRP